MATDPTRRIAKWDAKFKTDRVKAILDDLRPDMLSHVRAMFPLIASMEGQVKQVLDQEGVSIIDYPFYLDFGREVWKLQKNEVSGDSLAKEVATLIGKWVSRGLTQSVLETIRTQVFNVGPPTP